MSLSPTTTFNVQIDSQYRDVSKYPTFTDFGVKFKNNNTGTNLSGYPLTNAVNIQTQIDPDFSDASFQIINGSLQNLKRGTDGSIYISGIIDVLSLGGTFKIIQGNYNLYTLNENTIPSAFIAVFLPVASSYYLSWFVHLTPTSSPLPSSASYRIPPSRSIFEIDVSGNLYWMFDCSYAGVNVTSTLNTNGPLYTVVSPNQTTLRQYNVICAFDPLGSQYTVNGQPWGYHIISSNQDLQKTLENGKFNVKSNTALNLFCTTNTTPYDPYVYKTNEYTGTNVNGLYMYTGINGNTNMIELNTTSSNVKKLNVYNIDSDSNHSFISTLNTTTIFDVYGNGGVLFNYYSTGATKQVIIDTHGADQYDDPFPHYFFIYNINTNTGPYFNQNLNIDYSNNPTNGSTDYYKSTIKDHYLYISIQNRGGLGHNLPQGFVLWRLDLNNIGAHCSFLHFDTSVIIDGAGGIDIIGYGNYVITGVSTLAYSYFALCLWNTTTSSYSSYNYTSIGGQDITLGFGNVNFFVGQSDGLLYCYYNCSFGGYIFSIDLTTSPPTLNLVSILSVYNGVNVSIYNSNGKTYIVGSNGRIYDITNIYSPYKISDLYPTPDTGYTLNLIQAYNKACCGYYTNISTSNQKLITLPFIELPTSVTSSQYSKPIVKYNDIANNYKYHEIFTIPGTQQSSNTNFSPSQFLGNGLIGWYNTRSENNLTLDGSIITKFIDLSGNGSDLHYNSNLSLSTCPTYNNGYAVWTSSSAQYSPFSASLISPAKFVICSFYIDYSGSDNPNITVFKNWVDGAITILSLTVDPNSSTPGCICTALYNDDYHTTQTNSKPSSAYNPVYFGYNNPSNIGPFLAINTNISVPQGTSYVPYTGSSSPYVINIMDNISDMLGGGYLVLLKELIVLDFVPTTYQLSLFQTYFQSTTKPFPVENNPLSGVYALKTFSYDPKSWFSFECIDGSQIQGVPQLVPFVNSSSVNYDVVRHARCPFAGTFNFDTIGGSGITILPNIVATISSDSVLRVFVFDDFLYQVPGEGGYAYYDLTSLSMNNLVNVEIYFNSSTNSTYIAVSDKYLSFSIFELDQSGGFTPIYSLSLKSHYTVSLPEYFSLIFYFCDFKIKVYPDGKAYLFAIFGSSNPSYGEGPSNAAHFIIYNVTNPYLITEEFVFPWDPLILHSGCWIDHCNIVDYPDGKIYFFNQAEGAGYCNVFDVTIPSQTTLYKHKLADWGARNTITTSGNLDYESPMNFSPVSIFVNPVTKNIYALQRYGPGPPDDGSYDYCYLAYNDFTNLDSVPGSNLIKPIFYVNGTSYDKSISSINRIRHTVWNQKVWSFYSLVNFSDTTEGAVFLDVSNIDYTFTNYTNNLLSTQVSSKTYSNLQGIGISIINQLDGVGNSGWLSYLGGDGKTSNGKWSINNNISNLETDNSLQYLYVAGSWTNKITSYIVNSDGTSSPMNLISTSSSDSSVNSYILKMNINNGNFIWLSPSLGINDDYFERIHFISSNSSIAISSHFSSPVMLIYQPQTSVLNGTFTNPITTTLNLGNTSTVSSALISIDTNGKILWSSLFYTSEQARSTYMYDVTEDSGVITVVGLSNSNTLLNTDGLNNSYQTLYSDIDQYSQVMAFVYSFDILGNYIKSERVDFPRNMNVNIQDIKSFSFLNRIIFFANCKSLSLNGSIFCYNKDGTLGNSVNAYPVNTNFVQLFFYQYNSTYTDVNGKSYSKVLCKNYSNSDSLTNYKVFIQGGLQTFIPEHITSTYLNTEPTLNSNFSIRSSSTNGTDTTLILNSVISTKTINRYNLTGKSSISQTPLNAMISYTTGTVTNTYVMTQLFGPVPTTYTTTSEPIYYVSYYSFMDGRLISIPVTSVYLYRGIYYFTTNTTIPYIPSTFLYLLKLNEGANYTLQFYPGSINIPVYFKITLNSITLPNRPIKSYDYSGVRYLSDFPYIYLCVYNSDDSDNIDPNIFNTFYSNNADRTTTAIFTLASTTLGGGSNFAVLSSPYVPKVKFSPGYYNIRVKLFDPDGNLIVYDNTPTLTSDSSFKGTTVPDKLMRLVLSLTFNPA